MRFTLQAEIICRYIGQVLPAVIVLNIKIAFFNEYSLYLLWHVNCNLKNKLNLETNMPISIDGALGLHPQALLLRGKRAQLLSANIANADTPNYKARDFDFGSVLKAMTQQISNTKENPYSVSQQQDSLFPVDLLYRIPSQASIDGNTVDLQREQAEFTENAVRYQASLRFLDGRIKGLLTAIRGE